MAGYFVYFYFSLSGAQNMTKYSILLIKYYSEQAH